MTHRVLRLRVGLALLLAACTSDRAPASAPQPAPEPADAHRAGERDGAAFAEPNALETVPVKAKALEPCEPLQVELPAISMTQHDPEVVPPVVDGERLVPFYAKVARLLRGKADDHLRIGVYGDSNLTMDYTTGRMRRVLQGMYGDAGHGFVALARPWWAYTHMDVQHGMWGSWEPYCYSTDPVPDRLYGIGGMASESTYSGASAWVQTALDSSPIGRTASRFEVFFLRRSGYGDVHVEVDGVRLASAKSDAEETSLGHLRVDVDDAPHKARFLAGDNGRVRLLGAVLERHLAQPSFVVDSFGIGAGNSRSLAGTNEALNREMLAKRGYDLIIFLNGANDGFTLKDTPDALKRVIANHRQVLPDTPVLIVSPADRGKNRTFHFTRQAVEQRKVIAKDNETAFWSLWEAMGGEGSMARFKHRGLARSDYIHWNEAGGAWAGDRLTYALWRDLNGYLQANPRAGCEDPAMVAGGAGVGARSSARP